MSLTAEEALLMLHERDTALICTQGHVINRWMEFAPQVNPKYCQQCGSPAISVCPACGTPIPGGAGYYTYEVPRFCGECGAAYPWTKAAIDAASEYADTLDRLSRRERELLKSAITDLVRDDARRQTAAVRYETLVTKAGGAAWDVLRDILVNVVSDTIKRTLFGA
jgi:hypothetical protein